MRQVCPSCANPICPPSGHSKDILIISEFPGDEEMIQGRPFASNSRFMSAGKIFRKELELVGLSLSDFRVTNIWLHKPNDDENCFQAGYNHVLDEAKGKKAILLVGSDAVGTFTSYKVSDVSGLQVDSSVLSAPLIMAMINPASAMVMGHGIGEVRFAIERWKFHLEQEGLI